MTDEPEDVIVDAPAVEAPPAPDPEIVEEARLFGWKAPEEWVGDKPAGYIDDPKRYLDRIKDSRIFKTLNEQLRREAEADDREHLPMAMRPGCCRRSNCSATGAAPRSNWPSG
jgi:hypothetical protein